ncbi:MAG: MOSC domain-containing protein [Marinoscillum sp.]
MSHMKILSIQVGQPKSIIFNNREIRTSIFKEPVEGMVEVRKLGIDGDLQSDLTVHGGQYKAIYAYPTEHLDFWRELAPAHSFEFGAFGENLSTVGLLEPEVSIGDVFEFGSVILRVTQPRFPCFKLGIKFDDNKMIKLFHDSLKSGIYFEVIKEGAFQSGDSIVAVEKNGGVSIHDFVIAKNSNGTDADLIKRLIDDPNLMEEWREYFSKKVD